MAERLRILVTDGESRAALAVVRSLGRAHHVIVGAARPGSYAAVSRYCADSIVYPDPARDAQAFVTAIAHATNEQRVDIVMPITDVTVLLLAEHATQLPPTVRLPLPSLESLRRASDKATLAKAAIRLGVPVPATTFLPSANTLNENTAPRIYPVVVKPARSRVRTPNGWLSTRVEYARDRAELDTHLRALPDGAFPVLLQEKISGPGVGLFLCYDKGRCIAAFAHRRLREKPPSGGVSVLRESVELDLAALDDARKLLDDLGWHGVAMVEFKRDDRDGIAKLMEINGRFWGSLQLAVDAGVDFPLVLVEIAQQRTPTVPKKYRHGIRLRWFLGDLDALILSLFKKRERTHLPPEQRGRLKLLWEFIKPVARSRNEMLRWNDPTPGFLELWRWLLGRR